MTMAKALDYKRLIRVRKSFETDKFKLITFRFINAHHKQLEYSEYKAIGEVSMPNNDLINIANVLSEKLNSNAPTSLADMVVDNGQKKQLNYEIMFQLLMGECEKHILENVGNPIVDEFKDNILKKFSTLVQAIHNTE